MVGGGGYYAKTALPYSEHFATIKHMPDSWSQVRNQGKVGRTLPTLPAIPPLALMLVGVSVLAAAVLVWFLAQDPGYGAAERVTDLWLRLTVSPEGNVTIDEHFNVRAKVGGKFKGISRQFRLTDGLDAKVDCVAELEGKPIEIAKANEIDGVLFIPMARPIVVTKESNSFRLTCKAQGVVQSRGVERFLAWSLADPYLTIPIDRLNAEVIFLFDLKEDPRIPTPSFKARLVSATGNVSDIPVPRKKSNIYALSTNNRLESGSELTLFATWQPATPLL